MKTFCVLLHDGMQFTNNYVGPDKTTPCTLNHNDHVDANNDKKHIFLFLITSSNLLPYL